MRARGWMVLPVALLLAAGAPSKDDVARKDLDALKGTWVVSSGEEDGTPIAAEDAKKFKLVVDGDKYTFTIEGQAEETGTLKLDPSQKPKTVDIMIESGEDKGKTQYGVYDLDGDTLKMCVSRPGADRPKELSAKEGSKNTLFVFKRQK